MLSLDEAIKHCEEVAEEKEREAEYRQETQGDMFKFLDDLSKSVGGEGIENDALNECLECAKEHRQLAEWLRELKIHREIHDVLLQLLVDFDIDICCDDLMNNEEEQKICEENCDNKTKGCWVRWAKLKAREVNADDNIQS